MIVRKLAERVPDLLLSLLLDAFKCSFSYNLLKLPLVLANQGIGIKQGSYEEHEACNDIKIKRPLERNDVYNKAAEGCWEECDKNKKYP